jgi:hypothetical protein
MGCCCSGHAEAKESDHPPPMFGKDVKVSICKKGFLSADFTVKDLTEEDPKEWMLMDAVGGVFDSAFDFFLKYRATGMEESATLCSVNMQTEHDYLWYQVGDAWQKRGRHRDTGDKRNRCWTRKFVSGRWIIARRCRIFADREQTRLIGRLEIVGTGNYQRKYRHESWLQKQMVKVDKGEGNFEMVEKWVPRSRTWDDPETKMDRFDYDMTALGTDFRIMYHKEDSDSWFKSDTLYFQAVRASDGLPLFRVESDGAKKATVETFNQSDPVSSMVAAFAVAVKLDPKEFFGYCAKKTQSYISLDSHPGLVSGFGMNKDEYKCAFPTHGEMVMPPMGFAYGVPMETLQFATPVAVPVGTPFTPMAVPVGGAVPMAQPQMATPVGGGPPMAVPVGWQPVQMAEPVVMPSVTAVPVAVVADAAVAPMAVAVDMSDEDCDADSDASD